MLNNYNWSDGCCDISYNCSKDIASLFNGPKLDDGESRERQIIRTAAHLIIHYIKDCRQDFYPDLNQIEIKLTKLESNLATRCASHIVIFREKSMDLKVGQCMIQMTRPRVVIAPLAFRLTVQMHHQFGSNSLSNHGLCIFYFEVIKVFKKRTFS